MDRHDSRKMDRSFKLCLVQQNKLHNNVRIKIIKSSVFGENVLFKILNIKKTLVVDINNLIQLSYFFITNYKIFAIYCAFKISNTTGNQNGTPQLKK